jgi:hypothetical protein
LIALLKGESLLAHFSIFGLKVVVSKEWETNTVEHQFYKLTKSREKVYKSGKFTKMGNS